MKLRLTLHPSTRGLWFLAILFFLSASPWTPVEGQRVDAREKIRLLSEALKARDEGNLEVARENLEQLIAIAPEDESIQQLLNSVNRDLERQMRGEDPVFGRSGGVQPSDILGAPPTPNYSEGSGVTARTPSLPKVEKTPQGGLTTAEVDALLRQAAEQQKVLKEEAEGELARARQLRRKGELELAQAQLEAALSSLPRSLNTIQVQRELESELKEVLLLRVKRTIEEGSFEAAESLIAEYEGLSGPDKQSARMRERLLREEAQLVGGVAALMNPEFQAEQEALQELILKARAELIGGDFDSAEKTLNDLLLIDPNNLAAKTLRAKVAEALGDTTYMSRVGVRKEMLNEVGQSWERPLIIEKAGREELRMDDGNPILAKLNNIVIPRVTFNGELSRVIETLSELSVQYDTATEEGMGPGVNIVLIDPSGQDPRVNISLRNLSLGRILEFVTKQVDYQYDVGQDAVIVSRGDSSGGNTSLVTEFFPVSRATVIRLTGFRNDEAQGSAVPVDPFSPVPQASQASAPTVNEEEALMSFFARAGVPFETIGNGPQGSTLAFDGTQLIVTQTTRNLERLRNILRRYDQTKQVEIEAKFLEVQQGDLEELGFEWGFFSGGQPTFDSETGQPILDSTGQPVLQYDTNVQTSNRSLNSAFSIDPEAASLTITGPAVGNNVFPSLPPVTPNSADLAADVVSNLFGRTAIISGDDIEVSIRALARKTGSDLLSSPRLTVLSGKTASIVVAQELLYPTSYNDIQLPSPGGSREGSVSTIAIGAGTPQDFEKRNIGVEMEVTPTVEDNDNISLLLEPKVTEFEGFVEYGGPSVAVGGDGTVVTVPSGFFQPIFSTREVRTEVTIYDGATVVIGGLVREEIKEFQDKVPVLGDIPLVGRLFRSEGETAQKRNLMIFVTANLVSPGGSPSRQRLENVEPNTLFQNPTILTPGGTVNRNPEGN